ncbi:MAG: CPBP family intramembrane metalloprotease, partial [Actinobacteria bacterium]|nr:CPBP family intramembrane metalloprotease [Actinomycetota bacterium]
DAGALFEENGWRGYALPLLLRRYAPVTASVVLGLAWATWHYPVKYNALLDYGLAGGSAYLAAFTVKIVLLTVVITHFWQRVGGSTLLAIALHGLSNDAARLQGELLGDTARVAVLSELTISAPLAAVAGFLVWRTRGGLGRRSEP